MSSPPPSKRPRLTTAARTLSKPFKSPLKTPLHPVSANAPTPHPPHHPSSPLKPAANSAIHSNDNEHKPTLSPREDHAIVTPNHHSRRSVVGSGQRTPLPRPCSGGGAESSERIVELKKRHTKLLSQLSALQGRLQVETQALKLEQRSTPTSTTSTPNPTTTSQPKKAIPLEDSIHKWRTTTRAAAEIVYASTRDRVNRMGGLAGVRDKQRQSDERRREWEREAQEAEMERVKSDMAERRREIRRAERRGERGLEGDGGEEEDDSEESDVEGGGSEEVGGGEKEGRGGDGGDGGGGGGERAGEKAGGKEDEDGGYTMGMMLRDLNVEWGIVGWDEERGVWVD